MGVFGSSDSSPERKLEADLAFIKSRLDLLAKHAPGGVDNLDGKLKAIYEAARSGGTDLSAIERRLDAQQETLDAQKQSIDELRDLLKDLVGLLRNG